MLLKDYSEYNDITETGATILYVTPHPMFTWYMLPCPIKLVISVLPKIRPYRFTMFDKWALNNLDIFVTKPTFHPCIGINVDFGEYNIKRR